MNLGWSFIQVSEHFFETELDTLTSTSFAGGREGRVSSPFPSKLLGGLITNLEHSYSSLSIMESVFNWGTGREGGVSFPPLQNFLED